LEFALRAAGPNDGPFLYRLYENTHGRRFAQLPLSPAQRDNLLRIQSEAQRAGYRQQYPESKDLIIETAGAPVGRVWLSQSASAVHIVDIAVLPEYQGRGLGTAVLGQVIEHAATSCKSVRLSVDRMNARAAQLYRRLGFQVVGANEVYEEMELPVGDRLNSCARA
jgi:ribosomal protein S18 acetylase RimI-like enzyme